MKIITIHGWCATNFVDKVSIDEISFEKTKESALRHWKGQRISKCKIEIYVEKEYKETKQ